MSSTTDKVKGVANQAAGSFKKGVGKATDSNKLKLEGEAQKTKGKAQEAVGKAKDAVKDVVDKA